MLENGEFRKRCPLDSPLFGVAPEELTEQGSGCITMIHIGSRI